MWQSQDFAPRSSVTPAPGSLTSTAQLAATSSEPSRLTFLVLEPQLLLDLLAGEVDDAGELGAIEGLCDVVGAVVLDEGQQLLPAALLAQDLEDVGEAWTEEEQVQGVRAGRLAPGRWQARIWHLVLHHSLGQTCTASLPYLAKTALSGGHMRGTPGGSQQHRRDRSWRPEGPSQERSRLRSPEQLTCSRHAARCSGPFV